MDFEMEKENKNINILNTNTIEESIKRKDKAICKEIYNLYEYSSCLLKIYDATGRANKLDEQLSQDTTYRDYCFNKENLDKDDDLYNEIEGLTDRLKELMNNFDKFKTQIRNMSLVEISKLYSIVDMTNNVKDMHKLSTNLRYSIDNSNLEKFLKELFYKDITNYINKTNEMQKFDETMKIMKSYFI